MNNYDVLEMELRGCFDFFWNEANTDKNSPGFGIIRDNTKDHQKDFGSIASVGYGIATICIGVEKKYVSYEDAYERTVGTLRTFYNNADQINGFYYHFLNLQDAKRWKNNEVSIIDTALFLSGAFVAAEYFGGEVKELCNKIYDRMDWEWFRDKDSNAFYMGYCYSDGEYKFDPSSIWDHYAEQFIMYVFGAASPTHPVPADMFYSFDRWEDNYKEFKYIRTVSNSIFVYQFSHAFLDLRNSIDREGVDWFQNSVTATLAGRQWCIDNPLGKKTFSSLSWGLTACNYKHGYTGSFGPEPYGHRGEKYSYHYEPVNDGTIPPCGATGSIVFAPEEVIETLNHYYSQHPQMWGKYGFKDSYNLDETPVYYDPYYIGINKGITAVMISNHLDEFIWKQFMKNEYVQKGIELIEISKDVKSFSGCA